MDSPENKERLKMVFMQLYEVAKGNLWHRIKRTKDKDEMEALVALINMTTEEFRDSIRHQGYINFHDSYVYTVQMLLILDKDSKVERLNRGAMKLLGYTDIEILGRQFGGLVDKGSKKKWGRIKRQIEERSFEEKAVRLTLNTKKGLVFPAYCYIVPFFRSDPFGYNTVITAFEMVTSNRALERKTRVKVKGDGPIPKGGVKNKRILQAYDIDIIRSIGDYLRKHLREGIPRLSDLTDKFRINGFKLKNGFKELYGMTVFQYLKEERLRKAHVLIEHTSSTFKDIAKMVGFKSATHFSREFNARFGYRPRALRNATKK